MARERISLVSDEVKQQATLETRIRSGEINATNFKALSSEEQSQVNEILFEMACENVDPHKGSSVLEFILFGFMRVANKKMNGMALSEDEKFIEESLTQMMNRHEITNSTIDKSEWLLDYMKYAETKSEEILRNRKEHINRKRETMGEL
ncbi:hypothetical protein C2I27_04190 [Priestia megaterium]|uniref:hypothetical protein n=1 Tax=Priestia megaterium TaxID=1404 RepID=UPI000D506294|nr:hypothetical protein [Priestia megaterium]PVC75093.1 hypothetical protein C2I27_04190 [Priestia megaterium]